MKKTILLMFLLVLVAIPLVSATDESYIFRQTTNVDLKVPCFNATNFPCPSSTTCNITIFFPNNTILVENQNMTYNPTFFNYPLTDNQTKTTGEYYAVTSCFGQASGFSTFTYLVNPTGYDFTEGQGYSALGLLLGIVLIASLFTYIGFRFFESDKTFPIGLFFIVMAMILGVYSIHIGYIYSRDVLFSMGMEGSQFSIYIAVMWGMMAMAFIALLGLMIKTLKEIKIRRSYNQIDDGFYKDTGYNRQNSVRGFR